MPAKSKPTETQKRNALIAAARSTLIDEIGDLERKLAPHKGNIRRLEELRKTVRSWYLDENPLKTFAVHGERYFATVGACGNQTVIHDMPAVFDALGKERFLDSAKISLELLRENLDPALVGMVTLQEQSGPRPLAVLPVLPAK